MRRNVCGLVVAFCLLIPQYAHGQGISISVDSASRLEQVTGQLISANKAGNYGQALKLAKEAYALSDSMLGPTDPLTLAHINNVAYFHERLGQYGKAEPLYKEVLKKSRTILGENHRDTLSSINNLAFLYVKQGRYREAEELYEILMAKSIKYLGRNDPDTVANLNNVADLYQKIGRYEKAEMLFDEAFTKNKTLHGYRHRETLNAANNLGLLYKNLGRFEEAEELYKLVLKIRRDWRGETHPKTLVSMNNLGSLYISGGRYEEAELFIKTAFELRKKRFKDNHPSTLNSMTSLALLYHYQGRYGDAEPLYKTVFENRKRMLGELHPSTLTSMNNLAGLYHSQQRYDDAVLLFRTALERRLKALGEFHPDTLNSMNNLALLYYDLGGFAESEELYKKALAGRRNGLGTNHPETLLSMSNLALLYHIQNRYDEAAELYEKALEQRTIALGRKHPDTLGSMNNLAGLYASQGRSAEAEDLYKTALELSRSVFGKGHPSALTFARNYAIFLAATDREDLAAAALHEPFKSEISRLTRELQSAYGTVQRNQLLTTTNTIDIALSIAEKNESSATQELAIDAILLTKSLGGEYDAALRKVAFEKPELAGTIENLRIADASYSAAERAGRFQQSRREIQERDRLEAILSTASPELGGVLYDPNFGWSNVAKALPSKSVLIEYRIFKKIDFSNHKAKQQQHVAAVLIQPAQPPVLRFLGPLNEISHSLEILARFGGLETYQPCLKNPDAKCPLSDSAQIELDNLIGDAWPLDMVYQAQRQLTQKLVAPFGGAVRLAREVILAPDGVLHRISFDLLASPKRGHDLKFWIETQRLRVISTGRLLARPVGGQNTGRNRLFAVGAADYGPLSPDAECFVRLALRNGKACPLPGTKDEAEAIVGIARSSGLLADNPLTDTAAHEAAVKAGSQNARIVHLATHGIVAEKSYNTLPINRAALLFAGANYGVGYRDAHGEDGVLHGGEAASLPLHGTELVVLSACETALGLDAGSEGIYSMAHAFRLAGAKNVLMTLWAISDEHTRAFMQDFYKLWLSGVAKSPGEALRGTKLTWIATKPHNRHWAAFVLVQNQK